MIKYFICVLLFTVMIWIMFAGWVKEDEPLISNRYEYYDEVMHHLEDCTTDIDCETKNPHIPVD